MYTWSKANITRLKLVSHQTIYTQTKNSADFFTDFFFKLSVSFVSENRWKPTDLGVTPKDLPTDKN